MAGSQRLTELFGRRRFAIKPGLERIAALLERLGHPERSFTAIHIVGTNGKGSTAAFLAAILTQAGYRTGLFTSPHLIRYAERFQIDGIEIPQERLDFLVNDLLNSATSDETFFELTTALACRWFAENEVQIAVIEAGMGGHNDATAAVPGILTIITPISLDHCQWLGNSLEAIATEKCAIAAPGTPIVSSRQEPEVLSVLECYCRERGNQLILAGRDFDAVRTADGGLHFHSSAHSDNGPAPGLHGTYQIGNAAIALAASEQLTTVGFPVTPQAMWAGISSARWPGRMELVRMIDGTELLLDGAHNPAGSRALSEALTELGSRRMVLLLGMMDDKDMHGVLLPLLRHVQEVITVTPAQERSLPDTTLAAACRQLGIPARPCGSAAAGLETARTAARPGDLIVVAGSLYLIGEVTALLNGIPCEAVRG